jgi:hypothetical protein
MVMVMVLWKLRPLNRKRCDRLLLFRVSRLAARELFQGLASGDRGFGQVLGLQLKRPQEGPVDLLDRIPEDLVVVGIEPADAAAFGIGIGIPGRHVRFGTRSLSRSALHQTQNDLGHSPDNLFGNYVNGVF